MELLWKIIIAYFTLVLNQINEINSFNLGLALELTTIKPGSLWKFNSSFSCVTKPQYVYPQFLQENSTIIKTVAK